MPRTPEYQHFLDFKLGKIQDDQPLDQEIPANDQEIGWWKKEEVAKALHHARYGVATPEEIELLEKHDINYPWRAKKRTYQQKEKTHQS